jgi:phosphomevalonate decarboxylase
MRKIRAKAHPVQGLLCAHGYKDVEQKTLPVESLFTSLEAFHTVVEFTLVDDESIKPVINMKGHDVSDDAYQRITGFVKRIFEILKIRSSYSLDIELNFPLAVGIGSSASIFAAITRCIVSFTGKKLPGKEISVLARLGSHSAAASILGNISIIKKGKYAEVLCQAGSFPYKILVLPVEGKKRSEELHEDMPHSPFYSSWLKFARKTSSSLSTLISGKRFNEIGPIAERYIHTNFAAISTGPRNILTWNHETFRRVILLRELRTELNGTFFISTNSGPALFVYAEHEELEILKEKLKELQIESVMSDVGGPASLLPDANL